MLLESILKKIFGDPNAKELKNIQVIVDKINALEPEMQALSSANLAAKTGEFKLRLAKGETLDDILPEAFAVVRETSRRITGMRHFDVQLIGGVVLHRGKIAEMRTGEGKTLVATLPAYLNALTGKGVHVVTVNDYLARRDSEDMGRIYRALGLSVGLIVHDMDYPDRKAAYAADITYGTNNEFGFDYLRDNMVVDENQMVQRELNFCIVDEVDSILIDEARTPLIISGRLEKSAETYQLMAKVAPQLEKIKDYEVDEKNKNIILTEDGIDRAQEIIGVDDLFDINTQYAHHLLQALKAKELFVKDTDYVVRNGEVISAKFNGRDLKPEELKALGKDFKTEIGQFGHEAGSRYGLSNYEYVYRQKGGQTIRFDNSRRITNVTAVTQKDITKSDAIKNFLEKNDGIKSELENIASTGSISNGYRLGNMVYRDDAGRTFEIAGDKIKGLKLNKKITLCGKTFKAGDLIDGKYLGEWRKTAENGNAYDAVAAML